MILCFIAFPIFLILGIFSVKYRILAKDALECFGKTITFRKCKSKLDERIKSHLTGKIMKKSPKIGIFFYRNFQLISIIIMILFIASLFFSITGLFNYIKYGNCNGPENDGTFCIYSEILGDSSCDNLELCTNEECNCEDGEECICDDGTCIK
ncbi:hypothetical protein J4446_01665 [Candidatus Woesearchaeota archaeon]|nr:hypothetical protein [Candidatus Woesearchaeota archaeon]